MLMIVVSMPTSGSITKSTVHREKISSAASSLIADPVLDYSTGMWLGAHPKTDKAISYFQKKTGIQMGIVVSNSLEGYGTVAEYAEELYSRMFNQDEGHALFLWYEPANGTEGTGDYQTYLVCGYAVTPLLDAEGIEIVLDYFDASYNDYSLTEDEVIYNTLHDSADRLMSVTRSYVPIAIAAIVILIVVVIFVKYKKKEREDIERLLNTPLEHIKTSED